MSESREYNGWTNYETWLVALWMDNEQDSYRKAREMAREAQGRGVLYLADALKDWTEETLEGSLEAGGLAADLIRSALDEVNWREIADGLRDEVREDVEEEEEV